MSALKVGVNELKTTPQLSRATNLVRNLASRPLNANNQRPNNLARNLISVCHELNRRMSSRVRSRAWNRSLNVSLSSHVQSLVSHRSWTGQQTHQWRDVRNPDLNRDLSRVTNSVQSHGRNLDLNRLVQSRLVQSR